MPTLSNENQPKRRAPWYEGDVNDSVLNSLGAARGCQALNTPNNLATFIYDTSGNLRAANIYANAKQ